MERNMMGNGLMGNNMGMEYTILSKETREREFGKMEREKNG